ncbi:zinc finger protein 616-like [Dreissena polymorpha]|uniref:C2H2-type domain-containing protein n=1 Tax=Dreissena polymorpha TaxID=45954 RepID=A0A9D4MJ08_DREPO|nr:zinc finger protein 616-like [Dreissena polymorpha]KAH3876251.1 hypothetical protein DPMN_000088 [Dreissena polymorpha]
MDEDTSTNDDHDCHISDRVDVKMNQDTSRNDDQEDEIDGWSDTTEDLDMDTSLAVHVKTENEQTSEETGQAMKEENFPELQANAIVNLINTNKKNKTPVKKASPSKTDKKSPVKCEECGKVYHNARSLERHMNLHLGTYTCDKCGKVCNSTYSLINHAKVHEGFTGDVVCNVCDKVFCDKSSLNKHTLSVHMGITNYQCQFCNKSFFGKRTLDEHERVHTGERPFKCTLCPKSYKRIADLNHHLRLHKGEVSHTCELCGEGFRRVSEMNRHMRKHEQPDDLNSSMTLSEGHNCHWCNVFFPTAKDLKVHINTHLETTMQNRTLLTQQENEEKRKMVNNIVKDLQIGFQPSGSYMPLYPPLGPHISMGQNATYEAPLIAAGFIPPVEPLLDLPQIKIEVDDDMYNAAVLGTELNTSEKTSVGNVSSRERSVELVNAFGFNITGNLSSDLDVIAALNKENVCDVKNEFNENKINVNEGNFSAYNADTDIEDADEINNMINYESDGDDDSGINYIIKDKTEHDEFDSHCMPKNPDITSEESLSDNIQETVDITNSQKQADKMETAHINKLKINSAKKSKGHAYTNSSSEKEGNVLHEASAAEHAKDDGHLSSEKKASRRKRKSVPVKRKFKKREENAMKTDVVDNSSDQNEEGLIVQKTKTLEEKKENEENNEWPDSAVLNTKLKPIFCSTCDKTFSCKTALCKHMNLHKGTYTCKICDKVFAAKRSLKTHMDIHNGVKVNDKTCNVCGKSFFDVSSLNKHVKSVHMDYRPFSCTHCDLRFSDRKTLTEHIRVHTGERPFICDVCGKDFKRKGEMNYHIRKAHTDEQKFSCTECGKGFLRASKLKTHMEFKHSKLPYGCGVCRKHFQSEAHLIDHRRASHVNKPAEKNHMCEKCGRGFCKKSRLMRHLNSKTDCMEKPFFIKGKFVCRFCLREFDTMGEKAMHMKFEHRDSETNQFVCSTCGKGFRRSQALKIHMKIHLQIRDYKCDQCGACFVQKHHLTQHLRTHTGEKPYQCSICAKQFAQNATLYSHMKHH